MTLRVTRVSMRTGSLRVVARYTPSPASTNTGIHRLWPMKGTPLKKMAAMKLTLIRVADFWA